ncbi:MAG: hypothetical protein AAFW60_04280, partial [Pseudomonadota bacterium]
MELEDDERIWTWRNLDKLDGGIADDDEVCVAFEMREADGIDEGLADTRARAAISDLLKGESAGEEYGLQTLDLPAALKPGNVSLFSGIGYMLYAVELAMICGRAMR